LRRSSREGDLKGWPTQFPLYVPFLPFSPALDPRNRGPVQTPDPVLSAGAFSQPGLWRGQLAGQDGGLKVRLGLVLVSLSLLLRRMSL